MNRKKVLTIPNVLSLMRLLLIPVLIALIVNMNDDRFPFFIGICGFAFLLDFLDGLLARILEQESDFGKILDPVADKLLVLGLLTALLVKSDFPWWLAFFIFLRDALILLASIFLLRERGVIKSSLIIGKVTFAVLSLLILFYLLDLHDGIDFLSIKHFLIPICFVFVLISGCEYWFVYNQEKTKRMNRV